MFTCLPAHEEKLCFAILFSHIKTKTTQEEVYKIQSLQPAIQASIHKELRGKGC